MTIEKLTKLIETYPLNKMKFPDSSGKFHFVYLIIFENGYYYIGKHSTYNVSDSYFASGALPNKYRKLGYLWHKMILGYENSSTNALFLEASLLSNREIYDSEECLNCYPGSPPSAEGSVVIKKGNSFKMCNPKLLEYYLENGWCVGAPKRIRVTNFVDDKYILPDDLDVFLNNGYFIGRIGCRHRTFVEKDGKYKFIIREDIEKYEANGWVIKHPHTGKRVFKKDNNIVKIDQDVIDNYVANGYVHSSTVDSLIYINKDRKFKRVSECELQKYIDSGWRVGTNIVGTVYMNDGKSEIRVFPDKVVHNESRGYSLGRLSFQYFNDGVREYRIKPHDIDGITNCINLGYSRGKLIRTKKRKLSRNNEIRYIANEYVDNYIKRGWVLLN